MEPRRSWLAGCSRPYMREAVCFGNPCPFPTTSNPEARRDVAWQTALFCHVDKALNSSREGLLTPRPHELRSRTVSFVGRGLDLRSLPTGSRLDVAGWISTPSWGVGCRCKASGPRWGGLHQPISPRSDVTNPCTFHELLL